MSSMHAYVNGKFKEIVDIDTICDSIRFLVERSDNLAASAQQKMREMESEKWKDEELQTMRKKLEDAQSAMRNGFPISNEELSAIENWQLQHWEKQHNAKTLEDRLRAQGVSGGSFSYVFVPTSIGTSGVCRCNSCHNKVMKQIGDRENYKRFTDYLNKLEELKTQYDSEFEFQEIG